MTPFSIPTGYIAAWYGLLDERPPGWAPCDGANGTPDLRAHIGEWGRTCYLMKLPEAI